MILVLLERVVGPIRLELMTSRLSSVRSNQLSYGPIGHTDQPDQRGQNRSWARDRLDGLERLTRSGKRNEDGGDPLTVYNRCSNSRSWRNILRKEVIQPQVPLRLPCYDFTPVADPTVVACLSCELAQRLRVKPTPMV